MRHIKIQQDSPSSPETGPSKGDQARQRLLDAALEVFADKGYHAASTRDITRLAGANIAAIPYYFDSKAGLYRAVMHAPMQHLLDASEPMEHEPDTRQALLVFFRSLLPPFAVSKQAAQMLRLHLRERSDPSGVLEITPLSLIAIHYQRLMRVLQNELQLKKADADLYRLAFCVVGLCHPFLQGRPMVENFYPALLDSQRAIDTLIERLVDFAMALLDSERKRRLTGAA